MEHLSVRLKVPGIHCAGCIRTVERALQGVPGTTRVRVDYLRKEVRVEGEGPLEAWLGALEGVGYPASPLGDLQ
jgi:copper chaperone CopZ